MTTVSRVDPVLLACDLIRKPSVTPRDAGAMDVLQGVLADLGFSCRRMPFGEIENLYARRGTAGPNLCFAGHTDVVPPGDTGSWSADPFEARIVDGVLIGRGAVDMKGGIAAWTAAVAEVLAEGELPGSLSYLITGDEEGVALDGTKKVVQQLIAEGERIDHCVVGEPTSAAVLGDTVKVGRRGSLNVWITVDGRQGHVAYPERAANPIPTLIHLLDRLQGRRLDEGYPAFPPSNLEVTTIDVGNPATNVIPPRATARFNIRFNPSHTGAGLIAWIEEECRLASEASGRKVTLETLHSGDAFLTEPGPFVDAVMGAVEAVTGVRPDPNTKGGTSDARFIRAMCPVVELGLVGQTMHQIDERVPESEIRQLQAVYAQLIRGYFKTFA
ncbi:succinyl-diaminopimelate desuccinylase [Caulobacter sp. 17J80-11]|uniref:succinyl-diaminopimelate desuccinylase n=1 Tax=Caulobacter sp. 17J80-11 TaxID=2763502 RepID=UPI0016537E52|nr:succinyl-diaminopimelate desuccinylase [Caulobacter sp. 17J80-11]MBC6981674.1 succinyl-diaminopimelate desuccinylase [Caulobacter sp. 17J80-11]